MITLSERLNLAADFIKPGSRVCDVGTDHGYLPAFLVQRGDVAAVTATDINEKPLKKAEENLKKLGISGVELRLCDGLGTLSENEIDTVVIAGMGGEVISGIIERAPFLKKGVSLVLQPMTSADFLREYLAENGFCVQNERAVCENGKLYSVMLCFYNGEKRKLSMFEKRTGALDVCDAVARKYIERQYAICLGCAQQLSHTAETEKYKEFAETAKKLKNLLEGK